MFFPLSLSSPLFRICCWEFFMLVGLSFVILSFVLGATKKLIGSCSADDLKSVALSLMFVMLLERNRLA
jgi:hypothetical protein